MLQRYNLAVGILLLADLGVQIDLVPGHNTVGFVPLGFAFTPISLVVKGNVNHVVLFVFGDAVNWLLFAAGSLCSDAEVLTQARGLVHVRTDCNTLLVTFRQTRAEALLRASLVIAAVAVA